MTIDFTLTAAELRAALMAMSRGMLELPRKRDRAAAYRAGAKMDQAKHKAATMALARKRYGKGAAKVDANRRHAR